MGQGNEVMKICWDNLDKLKYSTRTGNWYVKGGGAAFTYKNGCKNCGEPFLAAINKSGPADFCCLECANSNTSGENNPFYGKKHSKSTKRKLSKYASSRNGRSASNWKGGYYSKNIPMYETYAHQLSWADEVRRSPDDENVLQIRCAYCGKWCLPTLGEVEGRRDALNGKNWVGMGRIYCSEKCKLECPTYGRRKYPRGFKVASSREVSPDLRQMCFERDNWECQRCGAKESLHCHHVKPVSQFAILQNDVENCITLCKECHKWVHSLEGCRYHELRRCAQ